MFKLSMIGHIITSGFHGGASSSSGVEDVAGAFASLPTRSGNRSDHALPSGVDRRSGGHALLMRAAKRLKAEEDHRIADRIGLDALGHAWNSELGLRFGDRVAVLDSGPVLGMQPTTWTHEGLVYAGWKDFRYNDCTCMLQDAFNGMNSSPHGSSISSFDWLLG